jgi:hypothetical protein
MYVNALRYQILGGKKAHRLTYEKAYAAARPAAAANARILPAAPVV